ncbi:MAG: hypothetical protein O2958_10260 [Gemmatimonadetes bacterium]|nr:hypothetical protein [Gemmatimonadota bacterium]MDA1103381.1 hypothetical protein [Gemmatimonadota bacterium]
MLRAFLRQVKAGAVRVAMATVVVLALAQPASAQLSYQSGQNISPAFEGWEANDDGSFSLVFGYLNRNWQEELDVPVGPENSLSPGPADQGQPTHFLPRRNRFVFKVRVPADFGDQEMVWTLVTQDKTEYAYGSLRTDYKLDNIVIASETGALGIGQSNAATRANTPPILTVEGDAVRHVSVGQPITIEATIADDGLEAEIRRTRALAERARQAPPPTAPPKLSERQLRPPVRITVNKSLGLHLSWFVFRGDGEVEFDPPQVKTWEDTRTGANSPWAPLYVRPPVPEDARWEVTVTFDQPGTYVLRGRADDGALFHDRDVTIVVRPVTQ